MKITVSIIGESNFVLTDDENRVIAIINVKESYESIDRQLSEAIKDDRGEEVTEFETELHITNETTSELEFDALIDDSSVTFYLTRTEVYK